MELLFFLLLLVTLVGFLVIGLTKGSYWFTYSGCILSIVLGLLVLTSGITTQKVSSFEVNDINSQITTITPTYQNVPATVELFPEIWVIGQALLFGGMIFLLISIYYSVFDRVV